jgi:hypothetical protein
MIDFFIHGWPWDTNSTDKDSSDRQLRFHVDRSDPFVKVHVNGGTEILVSKKELVKALKAIEESE